MMPGKRPAEPAVLTQQGAAYRDRFVARRQADPTATFAWPQHDGAPLSHHLLKPLLEMTADHCAYCDHFQLGVDGARKTIDHFRPKGDRRYWHLAFEWTNLYPCCDLCQEQKRETFVEGALAPDEAGYDFHRYFVVDFRSGELKPSPSAAEEDQRRARDTISWLGLNRDGLPARRRDWYERIFAPRRWGKRHPALNALPYRFLAPIVAP